MTGLLVIDPGWSTGIVQGWFTDTEPFQVNEVRQVEGGVVGFCDWFQNDYLFDRGVAVIERFTARQPLTRRASHALQVEGAAIALGLIPDEHGSVPPVREEFKYIPEFEDFAYQEPSQQYFASGKNLADKKKRAHAWLKEHGLYVTGKDVGCKDANDARSALLHAIAYMRSIRHKPTLKAFFEFKEDV